MLTVDGIDLNESQRLAWCADEEHGQVPKIRATFRPEYPFCVTTPSGEPIRAYRDYRHAVMAIQMIARETL